MEIILLFEDKKTLEAFGKIEVLNHLEKKVKDWIESHVAKRKLWFPSDFLPADEAKEFIVRGITKKLLRKRSNSGILKLSQV